MRFKREKVTLKLLEEMAHLFLAHHLEVSENPEMVLDPDPQAYVRAEGAGILRWFSMRNEEGEVAGYFTFYVTQFLHHVKHKQAHQGLLYIAPEHRGHFFDFFLVFVLAELKDEKVEKIYFAASTKNKLSDYFERKNLTKISTTWELETKNLNFDKSSVRFPMNYKFADRNED